MLSRMIDLFDFTFLIRGPARYLDGEKLLDSCEVIPLIIANGIDISEQAIENEIVKEESKEENLAKDKHITPKTELKKEKLKTEKK